MKKKKKKAPLSLPVVTDAGPAWRQVAGYSIASGWSRTSVPFRPSLGNLLGFGFFFFFFFFFFSVDDQLLYIEV